MAFHDILDLKWNCENAHDFFYFILFLCWVHVSALLLLVVSGNFMKMTMYLIFHVFSNLGKTIPNTALPGHFVQWWQILVKSGKGMFFCNSMSALLLSEGASAFGGLACSHVTCKCIELWKINFKPCVVLCQVSWVWAPSPVCNQKWRACIQGVKW